MTPEEISLREYLEARLAETERRLGRLEGMNVAIFVAVVGSIIGRLLGFGS